MSYYKKQLDQVDINSTYKPKVKISYEGGQTNYMDLNKECIEDLILWLNHYKKKQQARGIRVGRK